MKELDELVKNYRLSSIEVQKAYFERVYEIVHTPEKTYYFANSFLDLHKKSSALFDAILSFIQEEDMPKLVKKALDILRKEPNENAESVIAYVSLQLPSLLHEYLEEIYQLQPNEQTYYAEYPWRNSGKINFDFLQSIFNNPLRGEEYYKVWSCLLESRNWDNIAYAISQARQKAVFDNGFTVEENIDNHLPYIGLFRKDEQLYQFYNPKLYHLIFPKGYFQYELPIWLNKEKHPTWNLATEEPEYKVGGVLDKTSPTVFHHLITFEPIPESLEVTALDRLILGVHLTQIYEGILFYAHNQEGMPSPLFDIVVEENSYPEGYIAEATIKLAPTPSRWYFQDWALSNSRENLFRLGGEPTWIQSPEVITCPTCGETMKYIMQIDSGLPDEEGGEIMFGDSGIIYIFWCDKSKVSGYVFQCA